MSKVEFTVLEDLDKVNATSLLFESGEEIAILQIGKYVLSLICRGEVEIYFKNEKYCYASNYPKELVDILMGDKDWTDIEDLYIDSNNWFEYELLVASESEEALCGWNYVNEVNDYLDIAEDIERNLKDENIPKSVKLYNRMVEMMKYIKKEFANEVKDLDISNL